MIINNIKTDTYGKFESKPLDIQFSDGMNVIFGSNEAGKSTVRQIIRELMYGFQVKKLKKHVYQPKNKQNIKIQGTFTLDDGETVEVQRRLSDHVESVEVYQTQMINIDNEPMRELGFIPDLLFKGLYELELSDLVRLEQQKWSEVESQISLQYGLDNMLSPQQLIKQLEEQMHEIWRPHKRGKFTIKEIDERLIMLANQRTEAEKTFEKIRRQIEHKEELELEIGNIASQIDTFKIEESAIKKVLPAWRLADELRELETYLNANEVPDFSKEAFLQVQLENKKLRDDKNELDEALAQARRSMKPLNPIESSVHNEPEMAEQIRKMYSAYQVAVSNQANLKRDLEKSENDLMEASHQLTMDPWNDKLLEKWITLDIDGLEKKLKRGRLYQPGSAVPYLAFLLGLGGVTLGYIYSQMQFAFGGGALFLIGLFLINKARHYKSLEVHDILFRERIWLKRESFMTQCHVLRQFATEHYKKIESFSRHKHVLTEHEKAIQEQLDRFHIPKEEELHARVESLTEHLSRLESKIRDNNSITREKTKLSTQNRKAGHALLTNQQLYNSMRTTLLRLGETVEDGLDVLVDIHAKVIRAEKIRETLEDMGYDKQKLYDLKQVEDMEANMARLSEQIDALKDKQSTLKVQRASIEKDEAYLLKDHKLMEIETEIVALEQKRQEAVNLYNKLKMEHTLLTYADQVFREKYQPGIIKRASELLKYFTGGHYSELFLDSEGRLHVRSAFNDLVVPVVDSLSRGTLEQIYLSMRLALAESLDSQNTKMPIVLDEVFVNWDYERLTEALKVLKLISENRQVIYLTCHEWMAQKLSVENGAMYIEL